MGQASPIILDGYRLIRFLGSGGFGEVWLCRSEAMGDLHAIKLIPSSRPDRLEREYEALTNYRLVASLRSPHLVPIEHINWYEGGLCYVMPLADGEGGKGPEDPAWRPLGLDLLIETRRDQEQWFGSREIVGLFRPVLLALQTLSEARLVHRDVKPANILLFDGSPRLGDVSLLGEDAVTVTRRGTPGYAAPSWFEGGHPDMYSAGATLYALLTKPSGQNGTDLLSLAAAGGRLALRSRVGRVAAAPRRGEAGHRRADLRALHRFRGHARRAGWGDGTVPRAVPGEQSGGHFGTQSRSRRGLYGPHRRQSGAGRLRSGGRVRRGTFRPPSRDDGEPEAVAGSGHRPEGTRSDR